MPELIQDALAKFYRDLKITVDHPVYDRLPGVEQFAVAQQTPGGIEQLSQWLRKREDAIQLMADDPFRHGWEPTSDTAPRSCAQDWRPVWRDADELLAGSDELLVLGGNRAMKSEWSAKRSVQKLAGYRRAERSKPPIIWCLSTSEESSKRDQQPLIWKYLPAEWKGTRRSKGISYNDRSRFTDNFMVAPNSGEIWFKNYRQDINTIEGGQVDLVWADEEVPVEWVNTLRFRMIDRQGKIIITFTPIHGYNPTIGEYVAGARVIDTVACELFPNDKLYPGCPMGRVPYRMECLHPRRKIIFFQPKWNPWLPGAYNSVLDKARTLSRDKALIRVHGITNRSVGNKFPKFGKAHIIPADKIPKEGTNYHITDFAWNRPWAMIWVRVQRISDKRRIFVYRDWPDRSTYGEWVTPSGAKKDGDRGPAQNPLGLGTRSYRELILGLEGYRMDVEGKIADDSQAEAVYRRLGDPRSGRARAVTEDEGGTCLIEMMAEEDILIEPAKGVVMAEGINIINEWLDYNEDAPINAMNEPTLFVSEECEQLIECLRMWTGADGDKGASKDFVDLLRYAAVEDVDMVDDNMFVTTGGWAY